MDEMCSLSNIILEMLFKTKDSVILLKLVR